MSLFSSNSCVGIGWTPDGVCRAVKVVPDGHACRLLGFWQSAEGSPGTLSEKLSQALRELKADDSTTVVVGGSDCLCGVRDVCVPRLAAAHLKSALLFELRKFSPLPIDQLVWGYRVLPGAAGTPTQTVRLFYLRDQEWNRWVENISGLTHAVDLMLTAHVALEPAFAAVGVRLAEGQYVLPDGEGGRVVAELSGSEVGCLGEGESPLAVGGFNPGQLGALSVLQQQAFVPVVVLAVYGVLGDLARDRRTLPPLPGELLTRRNRVSKALAVLLLAYVVCVGLAWGGQSLAAALGHRRDLDRRLRQTREQVATLEAARNTESIETALREGLRQVDTALPGLSAVMAELTELIPPPNWVTKLTWTNGKIEIELQGNSSELPFVQNLEESPLLREVEVAEKRADPTGSQVMARLRMMAEGLFVGAAESQED